MLGKMLSDYFKKMNKLNSWRDTNECLKRRILRLYEEDLDVAIEIEQAIFDTLSNLKIKKHFD